MKTVWMFQIGPGEEKIELDLPIGATVVYVSSQEQGVVHLWVEVDPARTTSERTFVLHGTNDEIPNNHSYAGSVVNRPAVANHHVGAAVDVPIVWHLYEEER